MVTLLSIMVNSHSTWASIKAESATIMATADSSLVVCKLGLDILKECNKERVTQRTMAMIKAVIQVDPARLAATRRTLVATVDAITNTRTSILKADMVDSHSMAWDTNKTSEAAMVACRTHMECSSSTNKEAKIIEEEKAAVAAAVVAAFHSSSNSNRALLRLPVSSDNSSLRLECKVRLDQTITNSPVAGLTNRLVAPELVGTAVPRAGRASRGALQRDVIMLV